MIFLERAHAALAVDQDRLVLEFLDFADALGQLRKRNVPGIRIVELTAKDVVRHELVQKIVRAYEAYEAKEVEKA